MEVKIYDKSRVSEVNTTVTTILNDLSKRDFTADPYMTLQIGTLTQNNDLLTSALDEKGAHSVLGSFDEKRDQAVRVIFLEVKAKEQWHDTEINEAAKRINEELDKYGFETINLAYAQESAKINALLIDLKKPDVVEAISKLPGMNVLIARLEQTQEEFETAFLNYVDSKIEKGKLLSATKLAELLRKQINSETMVYLRGIALGQPEQYKKCYEVIREIIEINNSKVKKRLKKSDSEKDAPEA